MARSSSPSRAQLWLGLTRPRTLLSGANSVLVALFYALSLGSIDPLKMALLLVVAISTQIGSNIANDLIDFKKGADTDERTGPLRPSPRDSSPKAKYAERSTSPLPSSC